MTEMHPILTRLPVHHLNNFSYNYGSQVFIPPSTSEGALDLSLDSRKRATSPDYTYCYPSPKLSPCSNTNTAHNKCDCPQSQPIDLHHTEIKLSSYITSTTDNERHTETTCSLPSPKSPTSPSVISETSSETSLQSDVTDDRSSKGRKKLLRPFKIMGTDSIILSMDALRQLNSKDPLSSLLVDKTGLDPEETRRLMEESAKKYEEFREKMFLQLQNNNTGNTNENMRRAQNNLNRSHDPEYLEKRRKNNEAAKRSRDARRNKQDEIAIRARFLEQEYIMLKCKLKSEIEHLERLRKLEMEESLS